MVGPQLDRAAHGLLDQQAGGVAEVGPHGGRSGLGVAGGERGEDRLVLVGDVGQRPGASRWSRRRAWS